MSDTGMSLDERLVAAAIDALELFGVYLGKRLGLYDALVDGPATPGVLAEQAGIDPRYAREWLEQQAVAGVLAVEGGGDDPERRRYSLPEGNAGALVDPVDPANVTALAQMVVGIAGALDDVAAAYRSGSGVAFERYGADLRNGQGAINRPAFATALVPEWLAAVDGVTDTLTAGGRVADLGCGQGWSTIAIAQAFPEAEVFGIDADVASIDDAVRNAADAGVTPSLLRADASVLADHGPFDVILVLEALHDMARPVEVLSAARAALGEDGVLVVADEKVSPAFVAPGDELERFMYGWSITHCLPATMAEQPSAATGTVIRESTVRDLATMAGFDRFAVNDVDAGFFRIYELRP